MAVGRTNRIFVILHPIPSHEPTIESKFYSGTLRDDFQEIHPAMRFKMKRFGSSLWRLAWCVISVAAFGCSACNAHAQSDAGADDDAILTVGSKAPALDIEVWFTDREGEFEQITQFEPGKIYLIDFWATWSAVSKSWMVTYADLQDRYFEDRLQIIRVSVEEEEAVVNFLETSVKDQPETIYAEWALGYCVTTDPDRSVYEDYVVAAQQRNFPVVFIVGRTGHIEWLGSPSKVMQPLKKIVADKWDRESFGAKLLAEQWTNKMASEISELMLNGETEAALKLINKMVAEAPDSKIKTEMAKLRLEILLRMDGPGLAQAFKEVAADLAEDSYQLNKIAWSIVTHQMRGKEIGADLLKEAAEASRKAVQLARGEEDDRQLGMILDTQAHLVFLQGDLEKALELQTEASQLNDQDDILEFLDELYEEQAKRKKAEAKNVEAAIEDASGDQDNQQPNTEKAPDTDQEKMVPAEIES